jgi:starch-binding outer membrane protein, SusD/RagB family
MKHLLYCLFMVLVLASCKKDYLDRYPITEVAPQTFFRTEQDLILYTNSFYAYLPGESVITADLSSDNIENGTLDPLVAGMRVVPVTFGEAGWTFNRLRNINFFLANYSRAQIADAAKNKYAGIARFFRAWYYFDMMKRFGDVPWYSTPLETNDPDLYKPRDSRVLVTDSILADLDFAIAALDATKNNSIVTRWTALALKSRVALFEGTYRKYHTALNLTGGVQQLLAKCVEASDDLMKNGGYTAFYTGSNADYRNMFTSTTPNAEVILATHYSTTLVRTHNANGIFQVPTQGGTLGFTKDLVNSYLMRDGSPFSQIPGYDTLGFFKEMQNRDLRMSQTMRMPGYMRIGGTTVLIPDFGKSPVGYNVTKFVAGVEFDAYNSNVNALPVFRYSEVLLNYAEAKAELGTTTQQDLDRSINLTRKRGGLPALTIGAVPVDPTQQDLYPGITDPLILEVRRERRIELVMEGFRWYDLMRWKRGPLLQRTFRGMYFGRKGLFDLDENGSNDFALVDVLPPPANRLPGIQYFALGTSMKLSEGTKGNVIVHPNVNKVFDENKHYLYPLPLTELSLNPQLTQNPNWQ